MKNLFSGVKSPSFSQVSTVVMAILAALVFASCGKNTSAGGGNVTPIVTTLTISPSTNLVVSQGSTVTFSWVSNSSLVKVNGVINNTGSYTSPPLLENTDYVVTAGSLDNSVTVIVHVTVTSAPPPPNPIIVALTSGPWRIYKKEGQTTGPWFEYTLNPCELDDTQKFNIDGSVTWLDNTNQCSPVPYPPGSWSLPYPDSLRWNTVNRWVIATSDTLRLQWTTPCVGAGCPASGLALVRATYVK